MNYYLTLLRLRDIADKNSGIIKKGKKYLRQGQKPPKGVITHRGPKGGTYYIIEDRHTKFQDKSHELIRSRGVTKDQWDEIKQKYLDQGAESVDFLPQPEYGGVEGKKLYNIYVRWQDTDEKLAKKKQENKERFGKKKLSPDKIQAEIDKIRGIGQKKLDEASEWYRSKNPNPEDYLLNAEKARLKELEGMLPAKQEESLAGKEQITEEPVNVDPQGWVDLGDRLEIPALNGKGEVEGTYTVKPVGKYSAGIFFTPTGGVPERLTLKKERENRQSVNMSDAKDLVTRFYNTGINRFKRYIEDKRTDSKGSLIGDMIATALKQFFKSQMGEFSWSNDLDLKFENFEEARAWAQNNLKTPITGIEPTTELPHLAHLMAWMKRFEDTYGIAIPASVHLGLHADWGYRPAGLYYFDSNSMHFHQDRDTPYDIMHQASTAAYLEKKEEKGYNDQVPYICSGHPDATYWHEFGHVLDHLTRCNLSETINRLTPEEMGQLEKLSDYPKKYQDLSARNAEYLAESVSSIMTGQRDEYVPDQLKEAISQAFKEMASLTIDRSVPDPVHKKDWTPTEGEFYHKVRVPKNPNDISDQDLRDYYSGMTSDDLFSVLKNAQNSLSDPKLDPTKQKKESTREERYRIRQNMDRIATVVSDLHKERIKENPDYFTPISNDAWKEVTSENAWSVNPDGYEQIPFYFRNESREDVTDARGRVHSKWNMEKDTFTRNGILELRPSGAIGMALYHVDEDGNETLLVDHRRPARGIVDVERERQRTARNIKWQTSKLSRRSAYENEAGIYRDRAERQKKRQDEAKAKARDKPRPEKTSDTGPGPMHKDLVNWIRSNLGYNGEKRPSQLTQEEKEIVSSRMANGWMNISSARTSFETDKKNLMAALAKKPETRSEKILYKRQKDHLNELQASEDIFNTGVKKYLHQVMDKFGTDNPVLAQYVNDQVHGTFMFPNSLKRPSQMTEEDMKGNFSYRDLNRFKDLDTKLATILNDTTISPDSRAHVAETMKENKVMIQHAKKAINSGVVKRRNSEYYLSPPPEVAKVIRAEHYPKYMTVEEREEWENRLKSLPDTEFKQIWTNLHNLNLNKEWRKDKIPNWKMHWYHLDPNDFPKTDSQGNRRTV